MVGSDEVAGVIAAVFDAAALAACPSADGDGDGAVRAAESITKGMGWERVHAPVSVIGTPSKADTEACWDLGATVAATLAG